MLDVKVNVAREEDLNFRLRLPTSDFWSYTDALFVEIPAAAPRQSDLLKR